MTTLTPPKAFIGYLCICPRVTVRICWRCPDSPQAEREAKAAGQVIRHSLCIPCYNEIHTQRISR